MEEFVEWVRSRPYYEGQIRDHRVVPAQDPEFADVSLPKRLGTALSKAGVDRPFRHQATAVEAVRDGRNVVVATPTASGKSLAYTVPAFERAMDHGGRTLYLGPQNALVADQSETLSALAHGLGFGSRVSVATYTGRLTGTEKREVRKRRPTVVLTNPDMLHYALLPHAHRLWEWLFGSLETVVVDEIHTYRGVFGSHVGLALRRLARVCARYGSDPQFVCCSATIGNPVDHAAAVTGEPEASFDLVDGDASGSGERQWVLWNPPEYRDGRGARGRRKSSHVETKRLFVDLVSRGHQTLAFTRARQAAERYATESADDLRERGEGDLAGRIAAYQAALPHDRRREVEAALHAGDLRGVWSTNALELGVDVGGLDAVLLDGYPGTRMSAFQQAGRAGRGDDAALVVMVAGEDQLDQYFVRAPDDLFEGDPESAVVDTENDHLLPKHVRCAAAENWLSTADEDFFGPTFPDVVADLEAAGLLERRTTAEGTRWVDGGEGSPQHGVNLRTVGDREVDLLDRRDDDVVASLSLSDALRDAHPGAIYHQQGQSYEVTDLDLDRDVAHLAPTWADYYTRVLHDKRVAVERDLREKAFDARPDVPVRFAEVTVRTRVTGFERRDAKRGETLGREALDLPETALRTKALYFTVPDDVERAMREKGAAERTDRPTGGEYGFNGGIHAAEHGMISLFPLELLCDRGDVGGLSTPHHDHTGRSTIFVYDGHPGGVGLARAGYDAVERLAARTARLVATCDCADGCPSCVHSPHCGNANDPLAPGEAVVLLDALTGGGSEKELP